MNKEETIFYGHMENSGIIPFRFNRTYRPNIANNFVIIMYVDLYFNASCLIEL